MRQHLKNNAEVCHVWAQQVQEYGRAGNIYFERDRIFSYGAHYEMGRFFPAKGEKDAAVLVNSEGYSVSTAKHHSLLRRAISHLDSWHVPTMTDHIENAKYLYERAVSEKGRMLRARVFMDSSLDGLKREVLRYLERFPCKGAAKLTRQVEGLVFTVAELEKLDEKRAKWTQTLANREVIQEAQALKRRELQVEDLALWKLGLPCKTQYFDETALRVKGDRVETTHGASVTTQEAFALFQCMQHGRHVRGVRVGDYTVTDVTVEHLKIGCHAIPLDEVKRVGLELTAVLSPLPLEVVT